MREAGRAIAIDPDSPAAQNLMKRLLFELPREVPPEARAAIEAERQHATQSAFKAMTGAYLAFGFSVPLAFALGAPASWQLIATGISAVAMVIASAIYARKPRRPTVGFTIGLLATHAATLTFASLVLGPLLLLPVILVGSSAIAQTLPAVYFGRPVLLTHLGALLLPLALEWTGVTPHSYHAVGTSVVFDPPTLGVAGVDIIYVYVGAIVMQLVANYLVSRMQRRAQETAQEKVHAYAWHLAQLVR
jgi:ABC-type multidrug transport system fused ATPase/permease subunit